MQRQCQQLIKLKLQKAAAGTTLMFLRFRIKQGHYDTLHHIVHFTTLQYTLAEVDCTLNLTLSG